jgi:hypothetical protein
MIIINSQRPSMQGLQSTRNSYKLPCNISAMFLHFSPISLFPANAWFPMMQTRQLSGVGGWSNEEFMLLFCSRSGHGRTRDWRTALSTLKLRVFARAVRSEYCRPPRCACAAGTLQSTALSPRESGMLRRKESNRERVEWVFGSVPGQATAEGSYIKATRLL